MVEKMNDMRMIIENTEKMALQLRQMTDDTWNYVNQNIGSVISAMMVILEWAEELVKNGEEFPVDIILQQIQNLNDAYEKKDEVMLADTLEYEIVNALYVYQERGED